jgi:hypothetical protein
MATFSPQAHAPANAAEYVHKMRHGAKGSHTHFGFTGTVDGVEVWGAFRWLVGSPVRTDLYAPAMTAEQRRAVWRWFAEQVRANP